MSMRLTATLTRRWSWVATSAKRRFFDLNATLTVHPAVQNIAGRGTAAAVVRRSKD